MQRKLKRFNKTNFVFPNSDINTHIFNGIQIITSVIEPNFPKRTKLSRLHKQDQNGKNLNEKISATHFFLNRPLRDERY